jgi:hypothetical protein
VEPEGPQPHEGTGHQADSNVVRFPRDWLGPPEELVPLGRSESSGAPVEASSSGPGPQPAETAPDPTSLADDFWAGEGAGAIHDVLRAPDSVDAGPRVRGRDRLRSDFAALVVRRMRVVPLTQPVVVILCTVAGIALGVGILTAPERRAVRLARAHGSVAGASPSNRLMADGQVAVIPPIEKIAPRRPAAAHARAARAQRTVKESNAKSANTTPAVAAGYTPASTGSSVPAMSDQSTYATNSSPASTPAAQPAAGQSSSGSTSSAGATTPSVAASTSSGSSSGSSASPPSSNPSATSAGSGPSHPAFGANGVLGPGTSPNS